MTDRIRKLVELTKAGNMYNYPRDVEFDREDLFLLRQDRESKRLCEFILAQEPVITEYQTMTGFFNCSSVVVGDAFRRMGHEHFEKLLKDFYLKPIDNLSTFEWQHATADYDKVLRVGIKGIVAEIDAALDKFVDDEQIEFLKALKRVAETLIMWARKCSQRASEAASKTENPEYKRNLIELSESLKRVPENPPATFYEAVLTIYICFSADPDSVGMLDRYLSPFYFKDLSAGAITRENAIEYLQELFLMLQSCTDKNSKNFTRGGESHFCIRGYLPDGEDGFNDLSRLIVESLIELPTYIPQITVRWTSKTSRETFRFCMDCERKDTFGRIAFQNDEKRLKCFTGICGFPFEKAVGYTTVGCNEPAFVGAVTGSNSKINFLKSVETLFFKMSDEVISAGSFDEFYALFTNVMSADMDRACAYDDKFNIERSKDINYLSSLLFQGCVEKARSLTQGSADYVIASPMLLGITNVIDSLIVVKQFVYDEKSVPMRTLVSALQSDWQGYEDLRRTILRRGDFFGNDTDLSNSVAQRVYRSLYEYYKDKKNIFGYHFLVGDLLGYNEHHKWFGSKTKATPDGRAAGDIIKFGLGQSEGRDRHGLTAYLNSVAKVDPFAIACGSTVTNVSLDEKLITDDENFEKTVNIFETYFRLGGVHFQLTYVKKEDLIKARVTPEQYGNLRVRVSGFSDYFVNLPPDIQEDVIRRTEHVE